MSILADSGAGPNIACVPARRLYSSLMNAARRIQDSIDFIEDNLKEGISIHDIAERAHLSVFHFQRLFRLFTGFSVMEYLRKRRLACAAFDLIASGRRVIDAAMDYCYGYEQSLIRAFRREYGVTPDAFRKWKVDLTVMERKTAAREIPRGPFPEPRLTLRHRRRFLGIKTRLDPGDEEQSTVFRMKKEFIARWMPKIKKSRPLLFSFILFDSRSNGASFFPAVMTDGMGSAPAEMEIHETPVHWSFHMPLQLEKSVMDLDMEDFRLPFRHVHGFYVPATPYDPREMAFSYTVMDVRKSTNAFTECHIHAPVKQKAQNVHSLQAIVV